MFLKSLITAIVIMALTGGFIYWGTAPQAKISKGVDISRVDAEIDAKAAIQKAKPKEAWVDLNLRDNLVPDGNSQEIKPAAQKTVETPAFEDKKKRKKVEKIVKAKPETGDDKAASQTQNITTEKALDLEKEINQDLANAHRILAKGLIETKKISQPDLQDQGYLRLVDYAVANEIFGRANTIAKLLSSPELRDTARSRIAIGMARSGQSDRAFKLLNDVEVDALKDVLRLQVIEAATELRPPYGAPK